MLKNKFSKSEFEVGIDEAGRGCIAGPVTASAVILPKGFNNKYLDDSKKLSEKKRLDLKTIIEKEAIDYSVFFINAKTIDKINILKSTFKESFALFKVPNSTKPPARIALFPLGGSSNKSVGE